MNEKSCDCVPDSDEVATSNLWELQPSLLVPLFKCGRVFMFTARQALTDATEYLGVESDDLDSVIGVSRQIEGPDGEYAFAVGVFSGGI